MTVVSAMKFNPREAAIIADEQSSGGYRKYDISSKIRAFKIGDMAFEIGGSGVSDLLAEAANKLEVDFSSGKYVPETSLDFANALAQVLVAVKQNVIESNLQATYGLSIANFQTGQRIVKDEEGQVKTLPLDRELVNHYLRITAGRDEQLEPLLRNAFLILGNDGKTIQLYRVSMNYNQANLVPRPYENIGSGSESADMELSRFIESLPREKRDNINPVDGIAALLGAIDLASIRNIGVGGTPHIKVMKDGTVYAPGEKESRLALEIVKGVNRGYLPNEIQKEALPALMYEQGNFATVEKEMMKSAHNKSEFLRYLRGYKE